LNARDKNFTRAKMERRLAQIESILGSWPIAAGLNRVSFIVSLGLGPPVFHAR